MSTIRSPTPFKLRGESRFFNYNKGDSGMKKAVKIEIVFENCEVYEGTAPQQINVKVRGIETKDVLENCDGKIIRVDVDAITIRISPELTELRKRVMLNDITWAYVTYDDGSELAFCVPWEDLDAFENTYQQYHYESNGTLVIEIDKNFAKQATEEGNDKPMGKYTCPFCGKEYEDVNAFADCVTQCRQNNKKALEAAESEMRTKELNQLNAAFKEANELRRKYEKKYNTRLLPTNMFADLIL